MRYNLFHKCKLLLSNGFRFQINVDDSIFYNCGKDLDKRHRFKDTEMCVIGVVN